MRKPEKHSYAVLEDFGFLSLILPVSFITLVCILGFSPINGDYICLEFRLVKKSKRNNA